MAIEQAVPAMEKAFFEYQNKKLNDNAFCTRMSQILSAANLNGINKEFVVMLIDGKNEFNGMCVYPDMTEFSLVISNSLIYNNEISAYKSFCTEWNNTIHRYYIEIDKNCFDKSKIMLNPKELTAMLLHELSHVVYSDRTVEKFYRAYKINKAQLSRQELSVAKVAMSTLYIMPGIIACAAHKASTGKNGLREEYLCDKVFGLKEYQENLVSAIDKIIKAYGSRAVVDDNVDNKLTASMRWCNLNINELEFRRDALKRDLVNMASGTRSNYMKNCILDIFNKVGIGFKDRYSGYVVATESVVDDIVYDRIPINGFLAKYDIIDVVKEAETFERSIQYARSSYMAANEALFKKRAPKLPSSFSIDEVDIEIDKVENHQDRIYVLDCIHAKIEQISDFVEFYGEDSPEVRANKSKIDAYMKRLDSMRNRLLAKHSFDKSYSVFVKYPKGYEG